MERCGFGVIYVGSTMPPLLASKTEVPLPGNAEATAAGHFQDVKVIARFL